MNHDPGRCLEDIEIAAAIAAAMLDANADPRITLEVSNGVVTLEGEVEDSRERDMAESLVRGFATVSRIVNTVTVQTGSSP
jgi:osmotically-inducible protein OsmY